MEDKKQENGQYQENIPPKGNYRTCKKCKTVVESNTLRNNYYICPVCGSQFRIHAMRRIEMLVDNRYFTEWDKDLEFSDPLEFDGYEEKIRSLQKQHRLKEAVVTGQCRIGDNPVALGVMDTRFMMASMGHIVGEKITKLFERATSRRLPVVLYCCSGGARMQEGIVSLMQMAKTSAAVKAHSDKGLLYISVLTNPTTGGVTASFAMLGDIILAEPDAMIGFAGPRVIEDTTHQKLPEGFQRAEFLLKHGFVDQIVRRNEQKKVISDLLTYYSKPYRGRLKKSDQIVPLPPVTEHADKPAWDYVKAARTMTRPTGLDYINHLFDNFMELHGDRYFGDDAAVIGGVATFHGMPVTVLAQQKGKHSMEEAVYRNFGMPNPDGYRKSLRIMKLAEKNHLPVICFVDTPGAYPGIAAEERGQGEAIARNLFEMSSLETPIVSIVVGEGGSGGALALAVADEVWMLENSIYSILSPEGFASILYKDGNRAPEAAEEMRIRATDLRDLGVVEQVIAEEESLSVDDMTPVCDQLDQLLINFINTYSGYSASRLVRRRYKRFRKF